MTIDEINLARRDLEKRLRIDIAQFEKDTGVRVSNINQIRMRTVGHQAEPLIAIDVTLEIPK